jgi:hypothetical protein
MATPHKRVCLICPPNQSEASTHMRLQKC